MNMRPVLKALLLTCWIVACEGSTGPPSAGNAMDEIIVIAAGEQVQAVPPNEGFAVALSSAQELAEANGVDLGYPWIDPATGELVLSAVTPRGRSLLDAAKPGVPFRIRTMPFGAAELRRVQDGATFLNGQGVVDANLIYQTFPDDRDNRTVIVICRMSQPLVDALKVRYPAGALAIRVDPAGPC